MKKLTNVKEIIKQHKKDLFEKFEVKEIGIFGSYIRGEERKRSDIDILIEFKKPVGLFKFMDLEEYLEKLFGRKVDLVSKKALKPRIGKRILNEVIYI